MQPDLIISWGASKYDNFSKIAPTVPLELSGGPKDSIRIFGDILGRKAEAEQWITQFDTKVEAARKRFPAKLARMKHLPFSTFGKINCAYMGLSIWEATLYMKVCK